MSLRLFTLARTKINESEFYAVIWVAGKRHEGVKSLSVAKDTPGIAKAHLVYENNDEMNIYFEIDDLQSFEVNENE